MSAGLACALGLSVYASVGSLNDEDSVTTINIAAVSSTASAGYRNDEYITHTTETASVTTLRNTETITQTAAETETASLWLNINTATAAELENLYGIGSVLAARIVDYRINYGDFRNIEELMNIDGIGKKKFSAIKNNIYVENPVYDVPTEESTVTTAEITAESTFTEVTELEGETSLRLEDIAPININTAIEEELMLLPYVDESAAKGIIQLREAIGGFSHVYELLYVEELEQKEVAEIIEFVTVGQ